MKCVYCYWGIIASSPSQKAELDNTFIYIFTWRETALHASLTFLYILHAEALTGTILDYPQGCLCSALTWKIKCHTPEQKTGLFTVQYNKDSVFLRGKNWAGLLPYHERFGFPKHRVPQLWCKITICAVSPGPLCLTPLRFYSKLNWQELETHAPCCAISNKFLFMNQASYYLRPASLKQWQANLVSCM